MRNGYKWTGLILLIVLLGGMIKPISESTLKCFLIHHNRRAAILSGKLNREHFAADTTGRDIHYQNSQRLQEQLTDIYQSAIAYYWLSLLRKSGLITEPHLKRELELTYLDYLGSQGDRTQLDVIINQQTELERTFAIFRPQWEGKTVTNLDLKNVLASATNEEQLASAWMSGCQIGRIAGPKLINLVKLRNNLAREQGYRDFFQMKLVLNEQNEQELDTIVNQVEMLTCQDYSLYKQQMDTAMAKRYGIPVNQLKPWHYQQIFLQQVPPAYGERLDQYYQPVDITRAIADYFEQLGLPGQRIINDSDLKPREGKYPYAYCMDIDRQGDVRILANLSDDTDSARTLLHEMGHAVYDHGLSSSLPWRLREPASTALTEGVAMMFGDMASDPEWLHSRLGLSPGETQRLEAAGSSTRQLDDLIFCRWAIVMYKFEKALYANPDGRLDDYWWQLVKRYQLIDAPDQPPPCVWAAKVHLATAPVYYYQYLLGRIIACQLAAGWHKDLTAAQGQPTFVGVYLRDCVFAPGASLTWQDLLKSATGQKLDPMVLVQDSSN
ncbi:MAG: M2 family metallopeptidase [Methylocystaceae bacterium]